MINQEVIKSVNSTKFDKVSREEFISHISTNKQDNFAKTFVSKCDLLNKWNDVIGYWVNNELSGAILLTFSKKEPKTANLQLLHTFFKFRKLGIGSKLCEYVLSYAIDEEAKYFRVSSESNSVEFYKKLGIEFVGLQKSGCQLAFFELNNTTYKSIDYNIDSYIFKQITRRGKGSCIKIFKEYEGLDEFFES